MFKDHYDGWINSRMNGINKYITPGFFASKRILELGCGNAHVGNRFSHLGANVTSCDARPEHLDIAQQLYPHIHLQQLDCDNDSITEKYDIIVHWGLLYHLKKIDTHLKNVSEMCDVLLLETEVSDSDDHTFYIQTTESGYDQAFNNIGIRPSQSYVENILSENGFKYLCIKDPILNSSFHEYDWDVKNTKTWRGGLRRFWICWKGEIPLAPEFHSALES